MNIAEIKGKVAAMKRDGWDMEPFEALIARVDELEAALRPTDANEIDLADFTDGESEVILYATVTNEIEHGKFNDTKGLLLPVEAAKIINAFLDMRRRAYRAMIAPTTQGKG